MHLRLLLRRSRGRPRRGLARSSCCRKGRARVGATRPSGRWLRADDGRPNAARARSTPRLPFAVADYVDFYSSLEHATNVGRTVPARRRAAAAELAPPAGRLPRPRRHGRRQRHDDPAPARPDEAAGADAPTFGPSRAARHRARARLRRRRRRARSASRCRPSAFARPRLRLRARQRLERARHPGWEYEPLGPVPRQVVRHVDLGLGGAARALEPPRRGAAAGAARRSPYCAAAATGRSTSRSRSS